MWQPLGLATLSGLQLCQLRRFRELIFAVIAIAIVLAFVFTSEHLHHLIMNLNHFLFLGIGYIIGKSHFEYQRHVSRKASKKNRLLEEAF